MISVIIPVYNEEACITGTLASVFSAGAGEVIVVDGGSTDRTAERAGQYPAVLVHTEKSLPVQMNKGAAASRGDILLFLHADCTPEYGAFGRIITAVAGGCAGGCLRQRIDSDRIIYRYIEASGNIRARLFRIFYGDQAVFVRRDVFFSVGGYDNTELFSDGLFSAKVKKRWRTCMLDKKVYTSPRRWEKQGILKATFINWALTAGFLCGVPVSLLKSIYRDIR